MADVLSYQAITARIKWSSTPLNEALKVLLMPHTLSRALEKTIYIIWLVFPKFFRPHYVEPEREFSEALGFILCKQSGHTCDTGPILGGTFENLRAGVHAVFVRIRFEPRVVHKITWRQTWL